MKNTREYIAATCNAAGIAAAHTTELIEEFLTTDEDERLIYVERIWGAFGALEKIVDVIATLDRDSVLAYMESQDGEGYRNTMDSSLSMLRLFRAEIGSLMSAAIEEELGVNTVGSDEIN
jgi:hypothetical protein